MGQKIKAAFEALQLQTIKKKFLIDLDQLERIDINVCFLLFF